MKNPFRRKQSDIADPDIHSIPLHPHWDSTLGETLRNPTRYRYHFRSGERDWGGAHRYRYDVEPVGAPATYEHTDEWGKTKRYGYDPELVEPRPGRFGAEWEWKNHPEWQQTAYRDPEEEGWGLRLPFEEQVKADPNMLYRGISHEEWEQAKQRGYFDSNREYNIASEDGTLYSTEPGQAESYAAGFAPWHRKPGFQTPGYVVAVPRPPDAVQNGRMDTEMVVPGQVPFDQVQQAWRIRPTAIQHGDMDVRSEDYGKSYLGSPDVTNQGYAWQPVDLSQGMEPKVAGMDQYAEMVPIDHLKGLREYERHPDSGTDAAAQREHWDRLYNHISQYGIEEPLVLEYNHDTGQGYLGEGNHRLAVAEALGHTHVPVRVYRSTKTAPTWPMKQMHDPGTYSMRDDRGFSRFPQLAKPSEIGLPTSGPFEQKTENWYEQQQAERERVMAERERQQAEAPPEQPPLAHQEPVEMPPVPEDVQQILDLLNPRTANILDPMQHGLDPRVFDDPDSPQPTLKPEVQKWICRYIFEVLKRYGYDQPERWLTLVLTGSLTTYQYSDKSDVDISLFVDTKKFPEWSRAEMVALMVNHADGTKLPGTPHPLQCYVVPPEIKAKDLYRPDLRSGFVVYGPKAGSWLVPPNRERVHDVEHEMNDAYTVALLSCDKLDLLMRFEPAEARKFYEAVHKQRREDQIAGKGDFSTSNIVYKAITNRFGEDPFGSALASSSPPHPHTPAEVA